MCCIVLIRFRKACVAQNIVPPYRSRFQPIAAWICLGFCTFLLLMNGFTVFYPGNFTTSGFLVTYLGIPIFCILWLGHKFTVGRKMPWLYRPQLVDLMSGIREVEADAEAWAAEEAIKEERKKDGHAWWKKITLLWQ